MGNGAVRRYKGGKRPEKYFSEDMWPLVSDMLDKLGMNEGMGFILFKMFSDIDVDEGGSCDLEEIFGYLGRGRTKFSERIFDLKGQDSNEGLEFLPFSIALWSFCTMSPAMIARYLWEIFDLNNSGELEKCDIEAMFKMVYNLDHTEEKIIDKFPFEPKSLKISKTGFVETAKKDNKIIKPALTFQKRVRSKIGGMAMWDNLSVYRKRFFATYDMHSPTLDISLAQIVKAKNPNRKIEMADVALVQEKIQLQKKMDEAEREMRLKVRKDAEEARIKELTAEDRFMKVAWAKLDNQISIITEERYTIDDTWERAEARTHLFQLYDEAVEESVKYWLTRDDRERKLLVGSKEDHEARYADFMTTPEGMHERKRLVLIKSFELCLQKYPPKPRMSGTETSRMGAISEAQTRVIRLQTIFDKQFKAAVKKQEDYAALKDEVVDLDKKEDPELIMEVHSNKIDGEIKVAKKYLDRKEFQAIEKEVDNDLLEDVQRRGLQKFEWEVARSTEERRRMFIRKEFKIITDFGSRNTHWEFVFDNSVMRFVYVNTDTLQVLHDKTAICERCDVVFAQSDLRCQECDAARSAKNLKLYRPLGFKEIVPD